MVKDRATRSAALRVTSAVALAVAALVLICAASQGAAPTQQSRDFPHQVVLTQYDPLFSDAEIVRRLLSPISQESVRDNLARTHKALSLYPLDLAKESFLLYVPSAAPSSTHGYALLVFVLPRDRANLPFAWASQLERYGVIFVAPARAGNAAPVLSRRVPLALSAEANIARQYPVDPQRIYIGGFSGGSRVALRLALSYPDVFHGALLNAGADPVGDGEYPLPSRDLFLRFQTSSHLVYVTGVLDDFNLGGDASSAQSMREWCVSGVETHETPGAGHEVMSSMAFGRALDRLLNYVPPDPARLDSCRSRIGAELNGRLGQAEALISKGRSAAARKLLLDIDKRYGGLAAPRILELARRCACGLAGPSQTAPSG